MDDCELCVRLVSVGDKGSWGPGEFEGDRSGGVADGVSVSTFTRGDSQPADERPPTDEIDCMEAVGEGEE